ncbi:MAG TPA: hypothetical protein VGF09_01180 [Solirubrobacterales bacterium]|jgi:hypothetical protein
MKTIAASEFLPGVGVGAQSRTPLLLRLRVLFRRHALDRELAEGLAAEAARGRALRARQLIEPEHCRRLAVTLRDLVAHAESPPRAAFSSALPVRRELVLIWRDAFLDLAARLVQPGHTNATGVARVLRLLTDGAGPLFNPYSEQLMDEALRWIAEAFPELGPERFEAAGLAALQQSVR